jgi:1-acyl-sn-glycerol-3-phosphate acyltransferase
MKFFKTIYAFWMVFVFFSGFILIFPWLIFFHKIRKNIWNTYLYKAWSHIFYFLLGIPNPTHFAGNFSKKQTYIFCANHFSYLDIATIAGIMKGDYAFVGKSTILKVPLFGYMFRKLHIPVDRDSKVAAAKAFLQMKKALTEGRSLIIFPEGGIFSENPPQMVEFKDGAFKLAIETNTSIVPISLKWAWKVMPDNGKITLSWHKMESIVHAPIETTHLNMTDLPNLKAIVFETIQKDLA